MALIVIDGPRGVGKSKLASSLSASLPVHHVWSWDVIGKAVDTPKYAAILRDTINAVANGQIVVIENSWARTSLAEQLRQPTRGGPRSVEFVAEWQFGRLVQYCGLRVMMLAPSNLLAERRGEHRNSVDARYERAIYANYAKRWQWLSVSHEYDEASFNRAATYILRHVPKTPPSLEEYPGYCGPRHAAIVFVSSAEREELDICSGRFLPFASAQFTHIGAYLSQKALGFGWCHARRVPPVALRSAKVLIAIDDVAERWCWYNVGSRDVRTLGNVRQMVAQIKRHETVDILDRITEELDAYTQGRA